MEIKQIKDMTFKQKKSLLTLVFKEYHKAKILVEGYATKSYYPILNGMIVNEGKEMYDVSDKNIVLTNEKREHSQRMINSIDYVLNQMDDRSKEIIVKEFIEQNTSYWWINYYSRSTYYRAKTKAMEDILYYLMQ